MKKFALFVALSFLLSNNALAANKPVSGSSCNKVGMVQKSNSLRFTCIKSGKKLVWSFGVQTTNKQSDTPKSKNPQLTPSPTPAISATLRNFQNIWREIQKLKTEKPIPALPLDIRYSPTVNQTYAKSVMGGLNGAAQFWQAQFLPETPFPVLVFSEKDELWYMKQLVELGLDDEFINQKIQQYRGQADRTGSKMNSAGLNGYQNVKWFEFNFGTDFGNKNLGSEARLFELGSLKVGPHEYTHAVQSKVISDSSIAFAPCWFIEGSAEFYGMVLGATDLQALKEMRYNQVWERYYLNFDGMGYEPTKGWEAFLEENGSFNETSKPSNQCGPNGAYPVGAVATQYLYELKGNDGIIAFMKEIRATQDWRQAIQNVYGVSWSKMRKDIALYIKTIVAETPRK